MTTVTDWIPSTVRQWFDPAEKAMPTRVLGRTGIPMTLMTLGGGQFQPDVMERDLAVAITERAYALGVRSFDTAPNYGESEAAMGEALRDVRGSVVLSTKTEAADKSEAWRQIEESLTRLQTDHFDILYIHCFGFEDLYPDAEKALGSDGVLAALQEAKEQGVIRAIGASGHLYPSRYGMLLERDAVDVYMCAVNFVVRFMYNFEEKVFAPARDHNCGLVAMKVLGGASDWKSGVAPLAGQFMTRAIQYGMFLPGVASVNIGFRSVAELEDVVAQVRAAEPMSDAEMAELLGTGEAWAKEHLRLHGGAFYGGKMD